MSAIQFMPRCVNCSVDFNVKMLAAQCAFGVTKTRLQTQFTILVLFYEEVGQNLS